MIDVCPKCKDYPDYLTHLFNGNDVFWCKKCGALMVKSPFSRKAGEGETWLYPPITYDIRYLLECEY